MPVLGHSSENLSSEASAPTNGASSASSKKSSRAGKEGGGGFKGTKSASSTMFETGKKLSKKMAATKTATTKET